MGNCVMNRSKHTTTDKFSRGTVKFNIKLLPLPYTHPLIRERIFEKKQENVPVLNLMSNLLYLKRKHF